MVLQKNLGDQKREETSHLVSVVITTKNEEKNIENCLISIKTQSYQNIEIIVVDNFSTDNTVNIAKKYTENVVLKGPERSAQRNFGMINLSRGKYVMYVDADMVLAPILIENCVLKMVDEGTIALHVPEIILGKGYFSKVRRFERSFYDGTVIDGARFFNREKFCYVGGFDSELFKIGSGEDWDLDKKIKQIGKIECIESNCSSLLEEKKWALESFIEKRGVKFDKTYVGIYHNESDFKLIPYLRKKLYYTKGFEGYINKWGKQDSEIKKQFGLFYRYLIVYIEKNKWKKLISRIDLLFGMYFLRISVGMIYLYGKFRK